MDWEDKFAFYSEQLPEIPNTDLLDDYRNAINNQLGLLCKYTEVTNLMESSEPKIIVKVPATHYQKVNFNENYTFCYQSLLTGNKSRWISNTDRESLGITETDKITGGVFPDQLQVTDTLSIARSHYYDLMRQIYIKRTEIMNSYHIQVSELKNEWWDLYKEYMASPEWKEVREQRKEIDDYKCVMCGSESNLQVHHQHYGNVGCEHMDDLITVCYECHRKIHHYKEF